MNPKISGEWERSWIVEKNKRRENMVSNVTLKDKFSLFVLSVDVMLGKEALLILMNLSQLMTAKTG